MYGGDGLARDNGRVVLTPFVLPGERVQVEPAQVKKDLIHARLLQVLEPNPQRTDPPCPYFYRCGGCHYQHAAYAYQVEQKVAILREVLQRVGKIQPPEQIEVITGPEWGYRNRVQLHIRDGRVGYHALGSHDLVAIDHCPISSPAINNAIQALNQMVRDRRFPGFLRSLELFSNERETTVTVLETEKPVAKWFFEWCEEKIPGATASHIDYPTKHGTYRVSRHSFFQVNRFLVDTLVDTALDGLQGETALDLYAGVGLFSRPLAQRFPQVTAVESGRVAVRDLEVNRSAAIRAVGQDANIYLRDLRETPDLILADPPRAGLGHNLVEAIQRIRPAHLVLVACDPSTLARDLKNFLDSSYELNTISMIDLFPQTSHFESVAHLHRVSSTR